MIRARLKKLESLFQPQAEPVDDEAELLDNLVRRTARETAAIFKDQFPDIQGNAWAVANEQLLEAEPDNRFYASMFEAFEAPGGDGPPADEIEAAKYILAGGWREQGNEGGNES